MQSSISSPCDRFEHEHEAFAFTQWEQIFQDESYRHPQSPYSKVRLSSGLQISNANTQVRHMTNSRQSGNRIWTFGTVAYFRTGLGLQDGGTSRLFLMISVICATTPTRKTAKLLWSIMIACFSQRRKGFWKQGLQPRRLEIVYSFSQLDLFP